MKRRKGFTLTEILVTVIIIGVLASVTISKYTWVIERSRASEATEVLLTAYAGVRRLIIDGEEYGPPQPWQHSLSWTRLGMSDPNAMPNAYFSYSFKPNLPNARRINATRVSDNTKSLEIDLATGVITKTSPY